MKNRRKMKSILCLMLAAVFVFLCFSATVNAYTTITSGEYDISPAKSDFKNAKSPKYFTTPATISDSINQSHEMDIFHFEAPVEGYYAIYTTGTLDTIGAVYEENGALFWTHYDQVAYSDDTNYSPYYRNCLMVVDMDKDEDYYICVRAYASKTGNYTLTIEPNEDKRSLYNGGIWTCQDIGGVSQVFPTFANTSEKVYLTKEQALIQYLWLDDVQFTDGETGLTIDYDLIRETYNSDTAAAINLARAFLGLATCFTPPAVSLSVNILSEMINAVYEAATLTQDEIKDEFESKCNIIKTRPTINGASVGVLYTIESGIMIRKMNTITPTALFYTFDDSNHILTGEPYCYGTWTY